MKVLIAENYEDGAKKAADIIEKIVRENPECTLGLATGSSPVGMYRELTRRCPAAEAVMIGRGLLANPALARQIRGGAAASEEELRNWYMSLYRAWNERFQGTIALGRIKKLMEWPSEGDIRHRRLLRRAGRIEDCIRAVLGK